MIFRSSLVHNYKCNYLVSELYLEQNQVSIDESTDVTESTVEAEEEAGLFQSLGPNIFYAPTPN